MDRTLRRYTGIVTVVAFGAIAVAPRLGFAEPLPLAPPPAKLKLVDAPLALGSDYGTLVAQAVYVPPPPPPGYYQTPPPPGYYQTAPVQTVRVAPVPRVIKDWHEGEPIPPDYHPVRRMRTGLVAGGASLFGVVYLINLVIATAGADIANSCNTDFQGTQHCENTVWPMYLPVLGPFIEMGKTDSASAQLWLALDGIAMAGGLTMFIVGLAAPKTILVRNDLAEVHLGPMVTRSGSGAMLSGSF